MLLIGSWLFNLFRFKVYLDLHDFLFSVQVRTGFPPSYIILIVENFISCTRSNVLQLLLGNFYSHVSIDEDCYFFSQAFGILIRGLQLDKKNLFDRISIKLKCKKSIFFAV